MFCNQTNPGEYLVRCFYDLNMFKANFYLTIINSCIFIPWGIYVFVQTQCKIEAIGMSMICVTLLQQALMLTIAIIFFN